MIAAQDLERAKQDPHWGLLTATDELSKVRDGFDGLLELVCNRQGKEIRLRKEAMYFVMEPLYHQMREAVAMLAQVQKELRGTRHG